VIVGIGVDAVELARMRAALDRTPSLAQRLFTERELHSCRTRSGGWRVGGLAARFAAKEAVAKAFGTGIRGFAFRDVEVLNDHLGRPEVVLYAGAADVAAGLGVARVHLSLTTSVTVAIANAVLER
jgi:holo-[acyl-carrier protein] synthase